jgi:DNA-binding CsgD family transcriptional regulator
VTGRPRQVLTSREREIAYLAITHTNREIAERLRLSVRTVENHLRQVYTKLGIKGRKDLPHHPTVINASPK